MIDAVGMEERLPDRRDRAQDRRTFDKQIQVPQGQANVKAWIDDILPLLTDEDPLPSSAEETSAL